MKAILLVFVLNIIIGKIAVAQDIVWGYECQENQCVRIELNESNFQKAISLPVCQIFCGDTIGTLWPKPTGEVKLGKYMVHIDIDRVEFDIPTNKHTNLMWADNKKRFHDQINAMIPDKDLLKKEGRTLKIKININNSDKIDSNKLTLDTDESYKILLSQVNNKVLAEIKANTSFGARHGLETLSQLIIYDDIRREVQMIGEVEINDAPVYKHRGLLLDTARNYFSVKSIKRTLDAMGMAKLNTFHWHITDSHSFPLVLKSHPDLYKLGAYASRKIYTPENIADIISYGRSRGVRVIPEFDAPAHVGEGWQHTNMTACFNAQPWKDFCVEPPCGQFDPTVNELYDVLEDIYKEMFEMFDYPDYFHMGGDEVSTSCWNSSKIIQNWMLSKGWSLEEQDFMQLWGHFQTNALNRVDKVSKTKVPIIMWTSRLTELPYLDLYINKDRYVIQVWTTGSDPKIQDLLKRGYKLIISNYDALYLDCGSGGWVTDGNNWCSPYIGWQKVYSNNLDQVAGEFKDQILGAEAAIWSEQVDEFTLDAKFWPRGSALAERLWSNPKESWKQAESRFLIHRQRLTDNEIAADALEPEWCLQHENNCPIDAFDAKNSF